MAPAIPSQLMMSAIVRVRDCHGQFIKARALLDTCATAHFATENFALKLNTTIRTCSIKISAIAGMHTISKGIVELECFSLHSDFHKKLSFLIVPKIADRIPSEIFPRRGLELPRNIQLADPQFHLPRGVDLLIGAGATLSLISIGQKKLSLDDSDLYMQKTRFGWVIAGDAQSSSIKENVSCKFTDLVMQLSKFWEIDDLSSNSGKSVQEDDCEKHYRTHTKRDSTGRYIVRLPFKTNELDFGNTRSIALKRFFSLEKRLESEIKLKIEYNRVLKEYLTLEHMSLVHNEEAGGYYLPHQAVIKESSATTKVRVVFDASAESSDGASLNNNLMIGPLIQPKLFAHLIRLRAFRYVITADIEKMYRQVLIHPDERKYQYIFWRHEGRLRVFQLNTVTFGVSSASFLAIRTVQQLADDEGSQFPLAAKILKRDLYVDDLITGANSLEEILAIRDQSIALLKKGGFNIRQWASNHPHALDRLSENLKNLDFATGEDSILKTLGVSWDAKKDALIYKVRPTANKVTKRTIASEIARIFDPLGLLGPVIFFAKSLIQKCWIDKLNWDESVSGELHTSWSEFAKQLPLLNDLSFERYSLIEEPVEIQLHGFCDASLKGFGACIYLRSRDAHKNIEARLLCAKSRVAPLKAATIPRLELCGALVLARLYREVIENLPFTPVRTIFWSDSTIVLNWLKKSSSCLKVFESNRVSEIQEICRAIEWKHVRTRQNPADALSRGQLPREFLGNRDWFHGPEWLRKSESEWPYGPEVTVDDLPGLKKTACLITEVVQPFELIEKFSSYSKLIRVVAYCLRFLKTSKIKGPIIATEYREAEFRVVKYIQRIKFADEIHQINKGILKNGCNFAALSPFIGEDGLLRVGGRLRNANLAYDHKHPIILPSRCHLTDLIIREAHERNFHSGIQSTLCSIRHRFWILDGRNQVRKIIRACVKCRRFRAAPVQYKMSDLPSSRVEQALPFLHTGVDFFGPLYAKEKKLRNRNSIKTYGCVFVCMSSKAVHLEIVSDLSADAFLAAFKRFSARRGTPAHVYSDNGTNFVGANKQLIELYALLESEEYKERTVEFATQKGISWHFNPPQSPHFGGIWEAAVKSFKHHFRRVVGERLFTFEELTTLASEVEAILNSRPICSISSDPNDPLALTPAHLLIGRPLSIIPETDYSMIPGNRLSSWRLITKARQDFWKRWHLEYLSELQKRQKWVQGKENIRKDTVVVLIEKNQPCARWLLGCVDQIYPGDDGVVRVADIRTTKGIFRRNVTSLCPLLDD